MREYIFDGEHYRLPDNLSGFQREMYVHLVNWKWKHITKSPGLYGHNGGSVPYDTILPKSSVAGGALPHIYPAIVSNLRTHREVNPFRVHPHFYHMVSSQAANINLFLPILLRQSAASAVLSKIKGDFASLATDQLDNGYCLEFWGGNFSSNTLAKGPLGDKSKRSGTDADIAIAYRNHEGELCLWLIEHKLTEAEFTTCGGAKSKGRMPSHSCTYPFDHILKNKSLCYYQDVRKFKYWSITDKNRGFFVNAAHEKNCPFKGGMNQLWRNQLLALVMENDPVEPFRHASLSVVHHPENHALDASLNRYKKLINNNPQFSTFTSADVVAAALSINDPALTQWAQWYKELYML